MGKFYALLFLFSFGLAYFIYAVTLPKWAVSVKGTVTEIIPPSGQKGMPRARFKYIDLDGKLVNDLTPETNDVLHLQAGDPIVVVVWPFWPNSAQIKDVAVQRAGRCLYGIPVFGLLLVVSVLGLIQQRRELRASEPAK
jgi:hypothetical protein